MKIFKDIPKFSISKQKALCAATGSIVDFLSDEGCAEIGFISIKGFPASHIDLGWIQDNISNFWKRFDGTKEELADLVDDEIGNVIQRLKSRKVELTETHLNVKFSTKDDCGWYGYDFSVYLKRPKFKTEDNHIL